MEGEGVIVVWYVEHDLLEKLVHVQLGRLGCSVCVCVCACVCVCVCVHACVCECVKV